MENKGMIKLETILAERGMSKQNFAYSIGVSRAALYRYIHGDRKPTYDICVRMMQVLNLTRYEFMTLFEDD